jgi:hypothetical protein
LSHSLNPLVHPQVFDLVVFRQRRGTATFVAPPASDQVGQSVLAGVAQRFDQRSGVVVMRPAQRHRHIVMTRRRAPNLVMTLVHADAIASPCRPQSRAATRSSDPTLRVAAFRTGRFGTAIELGWDAFRERGNSAIRMKFLFLCGGSASRAIIYQAKCRGWTNGLAVLICVLMLVRFMVPDRASRRGPQGSMMSSHVTNHSAHDGSFDTALGGG